MKKKMTNMLAALTLTASLASCSSGEVALGVAVGAAILTPDPVYVCYPVYDSWGYYLYDDCFWEYYNAEGEKVSSELDISAEVADIESFKLERMAVHFSEKFGMNVDAAEKVAKNVSDFSALEDRSESDIADFAQRLYGINPSEMISAVGQAQIGNNTELDALIDQAAANFEISSDNTKALIKELHGNALEAAGINL